MITTHSLEFYIQSEYSSERKNKHYPLLHVVIEELLAPVVTVSGAIGLAVKATMIYEDDNEQRSKSAVTVWHPTDVYTFELGAKIALRRVLDIFNAKDYNRKQAFKGLTMAFKYGQKGVCGQREDAKRFKMIHVMETLDG
jgi:hypothetical protein